MWIFPIRKSGHQNHLASDKGTHRNQSQILAVTPSLDFLESASSACHLPRSLCKIYYFVASNYFPPLSPTGRWPTQTGTASVCVLDQRTTAAPIPGFSCFAHFIRASMNCPCSTYPFSVWSIPPLRISFTRREYTGIRPGPIAFERRAFFIGYVHHLL